LVEFCRSTRWRSRLQNRHFSQETQGDATIPPFRRAMPGTSTPERQSGDQISDWGNGISRGSKVTAHGGEQRIEIDGLLKKLLGKPVGATDRRQGQRRDDENGKSWTLKIFVEQQIPSADRRHRKIGDHEVGPVGLQVFQRVLATCGGENLPPFGLEHAA
jgi:hypothetical protein